MTIQIRHLAVRDRVLVHTFEGERLFGRVLPASADELVIRESRTGEIINLLACECASVTRPLNQ